jgi:hypothetical protein
MGESRLPTDTPTETLAGSGGERRFPAPWRARDTGRAFVVGDASGQALAYVYYEEEPGRRSAAKLLTRADPDAIIASRNRGFQALGAPG